MLSNSDGDTAPWGVVDYMLECELASPEIDDYLHPCRVPGLEGEIQVMPASRMDDQYRQKLARLELDTVASGAEHPLEKLLRQCRKEIQPDWIFIDARAGLAPASGLLLSGLAHLHVLFGSTNEQSWHGLRLVLERLGADRIREDRAQAACLLVQSMIPSHPEIAKISKEHFFVRAEDEFKANYFAEIPADDDRKDDVLYVDDTENDDAPHRPVEIEYSEKFAFFKSLEDVRDEMIKFEGYRDLDRRIAEISKVE